MNDSIWEVTSDTEEEVEIAPFEFRLRRLNQLKSQYGDSLIKFDRNPDPHTNKDALHYAIESGHLENILFLLDQNADVLRTTQDMLPPLIFFVASCCHPISRRPQQKFDEHQNVFEKMLQAGANPFQKTKFGLRLLTASVNTILFDRCLEIYKAGDPIELQEALNQSLWIAFRDAHPDTIIRLKKLGAVDETIRGKVFSFEPKIFIEMIDAIKEPLTLKLEDMQLNLQPPPGGLVVFYLAGHDMKLDCSGCVSCLMRPECQCSDLNSFWEKNESQIESLCSPNPLTTNQKGLIQYWSFYILDRFVFEQCVALQAFDLPVLVMIEIVKEMLENKWPNIDDYHYNKFLVNIKHFNDPEKKKK